MDSIKNKTRKEYFKEYYLKNKEKYSITDKKKNAGRPKKEKPKFSFKKLDTPIILTFD